MKENEALEARSAFERPLPAVPPEVIVGDNHEPDNGDQDTEGDLIDMAADEGRLVDAPRSSQLEIEPNAEESAPRVAAPEKSSPST